LPHQPEKGTAGPASRPWAQERALIQKLIEADNSGLLIYSSNPDAAKEYLEVNRKRSNKIMLSTYPVLR
jgi:hypothetical protein